MMTCGKASELAAALSKKNTDCFHPYKRSLPLILFINEFLSDLEIFVMSPDFKKKSNKQA